MTEFVEGFLYGAGCGVLLVCATFVSLFLRRFEPETTRSTDDTPVIGEKLSLRSQAYQLRLQEQARLEQLYCVTRNKIPTKGSNYEL